MLFKPTILPIFWTLSLPMQWRELCHKKNLLIETSIKEKRRFTLWGMPLVWFISVCKTNRIVAGASMEKDHKLCFQGFFTTLRVMVLDKIKSKKKQNWKLPFLVNQIIQYQNLMAQCVSSCHGRSWFEISVSNQYLLPQKPIRGKGWYLNMFMLLTGVPVWHTIPNST